MSHLGVLLAIMFVALGLVIPPPAPVGTRVTPLNAEEQAFVTLINSYRKEHGLQPLKVSPALEAAAQWMSHDMAQGNYFEHTDRLGRDPFQRMAAFGYAHNTEMGENIAAGNLTAQETFRQWQTSTLHNANMLDPHFRVMGIGRAYANDSKFQWYWTSDFGGYDDTGSAG